MCTRDFLCLVEKIEEDQYSCAVRGRGSRLRTKLAIPSVYEEQRRKGCDQFTSLVNRKLWARVNGWVNDDEDEGSLPIGRPCGKTRWGWRGVEGKVGLKGHFYPTTTLTQAGFQLKRTAEARTNRSQVESVQTPRARAGGFHFPPG